MEHTRDHGHDHGHAHDHAHDHHHEHPVKAEFMSADGKVYHSHDGLAPHTHEPLESPGFFSRRAQPISTRNFKERAFTVGIGGPVGTGKTALMLALCEDLRDKYSIAAVTNDIFTEEDGEFLVKHGALPPERIRAVQTGGCPHAAIREDISINLGPLEELSQSFNANILLCESGGGMTLTSMLIEFEQLLLRLELCYDLKAQVQNPSASVVTTSTPSTVGV